MNLPGVPSEFNPTGVPASYRRRTDWLVWVLVVVSGMAAGPVLGGGYTHLMLVIGSLLAFILFGVVLAHLSYKSLVGATWLSLAQVLLTVGVAVVDVVETRTVLVVPIGALVLIAALSLASALLLLRRMARA